MSDRTIFVMGGRKNKFVMGCAFSGPTYGNMYEEYIYNICEPRDRQKRSCTTQKIFDFSFVQRSETPKKIARKIPRGTCVVDR